MGNGMSAGVACVRLIEDLDEIATTPVNVEFPFTGPPAFRHSDWFVVAAARGAFPPPIVASLVSLSELPVGASLMLFNECLLSRPLNLNGATSGELDRCI